MCLTESPTMAEYFKGFFPGWLNSANPFTEWFNLPSMEPHNLWTLRRKAKLQPRADNGWKNDSNDLTYFRYIQPITLHTYDEC